eukprot:6703520-Prymnesium_polylepis.1
MASWLGEVGVTVGGRPRDVHRSLGGRCRCFCHTTSRPWSLVACERSWHTRYTKATFCDVSSRGGLPCASASEASAELLAVHSPPPEAWTARNWAHAADERQTFEPRGQRSPNMYNQASLDADSPSPQEYRWPERIS